MQKISKYILLGLVAINISAIGVQAQQNCSIFHEGTFKYTSADGEATVVIKNNVHKDYFAGTNTVITSQIEWLSDCECILTIRKIEGDEISLTVGKRMNIKVHHVTGNSVHLLLNVNLQLVCPF